jgi:hypothetical protein
MSTPTTPVPGTIYARWGGAHALGWCRHISDDNAASVNDEITKAQRRGDTVFFMDKGIIRVNGASVPDVPRPGWPERSPVWFVPLPAKEK